MFTHLRGLLRKSQKSSARHGNKRPCYRPRLELLEDRVTPSVSVVTNQPDYAPRSTAIFTASGFDPGTSVQFKVVKTSVSPNVVESLWSVTDGSSADLAPPADGTVQTSWYVDPAFSIGASFTLTATGLVGGHLKTASTTFTDGAASLSQGSNGPPGSTTQTVSWQHGDLNPNNSSYGEGDSVPFQAIISGLATGSSNTLDINYGNTAPNAGAHAYDYLASFNNTATQADPTDGGGLPPGATPSTFPIPADPFLIPAQGFNGSILPQSQRQMSIWNGTITNITYVSGPPVTGIQQGTNLNTVMEITFTVTDGNLKVVIAWGAHIASELNWGFGNGAGSVSGNPYHMGLTSLNGSSIGQQSRSIKTGAIANNFLIVDKVANQPGTTFSFTLSGPFNPTPPSFSLIGGTVANPGTITLG